MSPIRISILEDEKCESDKMISFLKRFSSENDIVFDISVFSNAEDFLLAYHKDQDILFLDIELPKKSGMDVAHSIRKIDSDVIIVFVTNLAQYAIEGYEVDAYDFVLKPFVYETMALKLQRLKNLVEHKKVDLEKQKMLSFNFKGKMTYLPIDDIDFIEVLNHDVIIHMEKGKVRFRCTMSNMVKQLENDYFCLCNSCYLINLKKVVSIQGDMVLVKDKWLKISQPKKKEFIRKVAAYMGGSL